MKRLKNALNKLVTYPPEKVFLAVSLISGLILLVLIPPFQTPDEVMHFERAYEVSELRLPNRDANDRSGSYLPSSIRKTEEATHGSVNPAATPGKIMFRPDEKYKLSFTAAALRIPLEPQMVEFYATTARPVPFPLTYAPQAAVISIAKLAGAPIIVMVYLVRLICLVVWVALMYWVVRLAPLRKWGVAMVGLLPLPLSMAVSSGVDAIMTGITMLVFAVVLRTWLDDKFYIKLSHYVFGMIAATIALFAKPISGVLMLIVLFVSNRSMKLPGNKLSFKAIFVILPIMLYFAWLFLTADRTGSGGTGTLPIHSGNMITGFVKNLFISLFIATPSGNATATSMVGNFGHLDTPMSMTMILSGIVMTALITLVGCKNERTKHIVGTMKLKMVNALLFGYVAAVYLAMYIYATYTDSAGISGVQGRYLVPVLLCGAMLWTSKHLRVPESVYRRWSFFGVMGLLVAAYIAVIARYYVAGL